MSESNSIVVASAMEMEVSPLISKMRLTKVRHPSYSNLKFFRDITSDGVEKKVLVFGIGEENANKAAALLLEMSPRLVVNVGFAGGLNPAFKKGTLFFPSEIRTLEGEKAPCNPFQDFSGEKMLQTPRELFPSFYQGTLLTSKKIVASCQEKKKLSAFGDAVDMEAFYLANALSTQKIPFFCAKVISDSVDEPIPIDFSPAMQDGIVLPFKAFYLMFLHPHRMLSLFRLILWMKKYSHFVSQVAEIFFHFPKEIQEVQH
jgi:nucleoside phosphorylase